MRPRARIVAGRRGKMENRAADDQAAQGGAGDAGDLKDAAAPGDGVAELRGRHELRQQGGSRRPAQGLAHRPDQQKHVNPAEGAVGVDCRGQGKRNHAGCGKHQRKDVATVEAIGDVSTGNRQRHHRQGLHQPEPSQGQCPVVPACRAVDIDAHRHGFDLLREGHEEPARGVEPVRADPPGRVGIGFGRRLRRVAGHVDVRRHPTAAKAGPLSLRKRIMEAYRNSRSPSIRVKVAPFTALVRT